MVKGKIIAIIGITLVTISIAIFLIALQYFMHNLFYSPPDIFTINEPTQAAFSDSQFQYIVGQATRGKELPEESRNIFACNDKNRDPAYWLVFELPKEKIPSFVEKITEVEFEELANGISLEHYRISKGPRNWRDGLLGEQYWDLNNVENGRHFEDGFFYCGVDIERGKIFLCYWTM